MGEVSERKMNIHGDDNPIDTKQDDSQDKSEIVCPLSSDWVIN